MTPEEPTLDLEPCAINSMEFKVINQLGDPVNPSLSVRDMTPDEIKDKCRSQSKTIRELKARLEIYDEIAELKARLKELE